MIVTDHFVYIHVSRTGGTFLNKLILQQVPGARMVQYHGQLRDLPPEFSGLPVIGFVRNPWDWYVSMYCDYRRKQQYVFQILSDRGVLGFPETVTRFLTLGDDDEKNRRHRDQLVKAAPVRINAQNPTRRQVPGLRSEQFAAYPADTGYYSWLWQLMFASENDQEIHIGRFENLREEALRLFEETGTSINNGIASYLKEAKPLNPSPRPKSFVGGYPPKLERLVAEKDRYIVDRFGYTLQETVEYPKANYFRHLGTADVDVLIRRVESVPDSLWESENEGKPNKFARLNDTRHIILRYIDHSENMFDYRDHPELWDGWKEMLEPIMEQAASALGYDDYRFPRVMLARLPAGGEVSGHSDGEASHYIHKIHVPLVTNPETVFRIGQQEKHLPVGEIVEVNNKRNHAVRNDGDCDRIHLIFECYSMEDYGKTG